METLTAIIIAFIVPLYTFHRVPSEFYPPLWYVFGVLLVGWGLHVLPYVCGLLVAIVLYLSALEMPSSADQKNPQP
jgi:hypothetical protein